MAGEGGAAAKPLSSSLALAALISPHRPDSLFTFHFLRRAALRLPVAMRIFVAEANQAFDGCFIEVEA